MHRIIFICALAACLVPSAPAQSETELLPTGGLARQYFGCAAALDGDVALVGAFRDGQNGIDAGAAYVFELVPGSGWTQTQKLVGADTSTSDFFGDTVALEGDVAVVGARRDSDPVAGTFVGSAYVFRRTGGVWLQEQKLLPPVLQAHLEFGKGLAISGDVIAVGSYGDDDGAFDSGAVFVFRHIGTSWIFEQKLKAAVPQISASFGYSIAVEGDRMVVGAASHDSIAADDGVAYIFEYDGSTWSQTQIMSASDAEAGDGFGAGVAMSGDTVAVAAPREDDGGADSGAIYVFERAGGIYTEVQKLDPQGEGGGDLLGFSLGISGDRIVGGAQRSDTIATNAGCAWVFERNGATWTQERQLLASNGQFGDSFGVAVAVDGERVLVGARDADPQGFASGTAYVFDLPRHYPGSGDDLRLRTGVNAAVDGDDLKPITTGDALAINLDSPAGSLAAVPFLLLGQLYTTGAPPVSPPGFPEVHLDALATPAPFVLFDGLPGLFGSTLIPPSGIEIAIGIPGTLPGASLMVQGLSVSGSRASNGIFSMTHGHELRFF